MAKKIEQRFDNNLLLSAVWESSADAMRITDSKGIVIDVNRPYCSLTGMEKNKLVGKLFNIVYDKKDGKRVLNDYFEYLNSGKIFERAEKKLVLHDGKLCCLEASYSEIEMSGEKYILGIFRDITERKNIENALLSSETKFRNLVENALTGIYTSNLEGKLLFVNKAMLEIFEFDTIDEMLNVNVKTLYKSKGERDIFISEIKKSNHLLNYELELVTKRGKIKNVILNSFLSKDSITGIMLDITAKKKAEEEAQIVKNRFYQLAEQSNTWIWEVDSKGLYTSASRIVEEVTGYKPDELIGKKHFYDLHPEEGREAFKSNALKMFSKKEPFIELENKLLTKNSKEIWVQTNAFPIIDSKENLIGYYGIDTDIRDRKSIEMKLKDSERLLNESQQVSRIGSYTLDIISGFWKGSATLDELFGIDEKDDRSIHGWLSIIHPDHQKMMSEYMAKDVLEKKGRFDKEYKIIAKNSNEIRWVHGIGELEFDGNNNPIKMIGTIQDITERKHAEETEESIRNQLRTVLDTVPSYIFAKDYDGKFLMVNKSLADLFGVSPEEVIGKTDADYGATKEQIEGYVTADRLVIDSGKELFIKEERVLRKDGSLGWFQTNKIPYHHPGSDKPAILGVAVDITDRKNAEELLLESEERLRLAMSASQQGWFDLNIPTGEATVSPEYAKLLGYEPEEFNAGFESWLESVHPNDRDNVLKVIDEGIKSGEAKSVEYRRRNKSGDWIWLRSIGKIFEYDSENKPMRMIGTHTDITDRKKVEEEIVMLANSLKSVNECVNITDKKNHIIFVNQAFLETYGYTEEEIIGQHVKILGSIKNPENIHNEIFDSALKGGWKGELINKRKDGTEFSIYLSSTPIIDSKGGLVAFIGVSNDITERKKAEKILLEAKEKAEASDRLKTAFLNNISHEIRTPLNGILGFAEIITQPDITEEDRFVYLKDLEFSTNRLVNTITDYMDISLIVSDNMKVNEKKFHPINMLRKLSKKYQKLASDENLRFINQYPEKLTDFSINSDEELIEKVLSHFLSNAIKYTEKGSISFGVSITDKDIEFFVKDTGIGIDEKAKEIIFDYFRQETEGDTRYYEGSGLGLSISKGIAELLEGNIRVESVKNVGSAFYFVLPIKKLIGKNIFASVPTAAAKISKDIFVLIVENDDTNIKVLEQFLKKENMKIILAENGISAVEKFRNHPEINLILMDIKMPVMDGLEATKQIKSIRNDVPVIAVTAYAMKGDEIKIREAGCDDYIAKPFGKDFLLKKIYKYIKQI